MKFGFRNNSDTPVKSYYHTFQHDFGKGEVLLGQAVAFGGTTQFDVRRRHPDGSVMRAIISTQTGDYGPKEARSVDVRCIVPNNAPADIKPVLPNIVDALKMKDGTSVTVTPGSAVYFDTRLNGPLMREDRYVAKIDDLLAVFFDIRTYEDGTYWVSDSIESPWLQPDNPEVRRYDATITLDGTVIRSEPGVQHFPKTRWRTKINDYPLQPIYDMGYYAHIGAIAYYDLGLAPSAATKASWLKTQAAHAGLYQCGKIRAGWPATGYGDEESPMPAPTVGYLLTQDPDFYFLMCDTAERAGYWNTFYREKDTYRVPTVATQLTFSNHSNYANKPFGEKPVVDPEIPLDPTITDPAKQKNKVTLKDILGLTAEDSHAPQLSYTAALLTGDRWHEEQALTMAFWPAVTTGSGEGGRDGAKGLVDWKETRGIARNLRDVIYAAYLAPDNDPAQAQLKYQAEANFAHLLATVMADARNTLHAHNHVSAKDDQRLTAPWQNDELVTTFAQGVRMGYAGAQECLDWSATYINGRANGEGQDRRTGAMYHRLDRGGVLTPDGTPTPDPVTWAYATSETLKMSPAVLVDGQLYDPGEAAHYSWYWRGGLGVTAVYSKTMADVSKANFDLVDADIAALKKPTAIGAEWAFMPALPPAVDGPAAYVPPVVVPPPGDVPPVDDGTFTLTFGGKTYKGVLTPA